MTASPCDEIYGLHNWPGLTLGTIGMRAGPFMAAADRFDITVTGKGGHAAYPHLCIDPIVIGAQIVSGLQTLVSREVEPIESAVLTITNFNGGTGGFNVIPDSVTLERTLRTFTPEVRTVMKERSITLVNSIAASFGATGECVYEEGAYDPTINDARVTDFCADIARGIVGEDKVDTKISPTPGAEDFGAMLQNVPGCYIVMGQGEADIASPHNQGLHTPRYDFNDAIIPQGIEYWVRIVETALIKGA